MIDVFTWATPNGHKIHIMLEECGLPWTVHAVDIGAGDQFEPEFLAISPNNKIPALTDSDGPDGKPISLFESVQSCSTLPQKTGRFLPKDARGKYVALQWLMFQMGGVGPMFGQAHHFRKLRARKIEYAVNRYTREANRLYAVMDKQLGKAPYFRRRILDRGHRHFSLDPFVREPGRQSRRVPQSEALVRCDQCPPRSAAWGAGSCRSPAPDHRRKGARHPVWRQAICAPLTSGRLSLSLFATIGRPL